MRISDGNEDQNRERTRTPTDSKNLLDERLRHMLTDNDKQNLEVNSKIKKLIKAHNRHLRLQEELKRSHVQVLKLGDQLDFNAARQGSNKEDSKSNAVSEDEIGVTNASPLNECQINSSPSQKK